MTDSKYQFEIPLWLWGLNRKKLEIDAAGVKFDNSYIACSEFEYLTIGILQKSINGIRARSDHNICIEGGNKKIRMEFNDAFYFSYQKKLFEQVYPAVMEHVGSAILKKMLTVMSENGEVKIGNATFTGAGAKLFSRKFLFFKGPPIAVPYERLRYSLDNGTLILTDDLHRKITCRVPLRTTRNACLIQSLCRLLANNTESAKLANN